MEDSTLRKPRETEEGKGSPTRKAIIEILILIGIVLLVFIGLRLVLQSYRVEGASMETSFHDGDFLLVNKVTYRFHSPRHGDVIIFHPPEGLLTTEPYVKRVIGLPGERVEIRDDRIYIHTADGEVLQDPWVTPWGEDEIFPKEGVFGDGEYFVVGDNREPGKSSDSRTWGTISKGDIIGKVSLCYFPVGSWQLAGGYDTEEVDEIASSEATTYIAQNSSCATASL
jgi:signal peptidase I